MNKILRIALILLLTPVLLCMTACTKAQSDSMTLVVFKVGQADAMVLRSPHGVIMIDTGEDDDGAELLKYFKNTNISTINYLIITHFDKDHVGSADTLVENMKIKHVFVPNYTGSGKQYEQYVQAMADYNIKAKTIKKKTTVSLPGGTISFTLYPAAQANYAASNDNNQSLVISLTHGENSFLFTGDAETERIDELLQMGNLSHTFLKVPHHGVYCEKSEEFFQAVSPKYAVITCSDKNPEDEETVSALEDLGAKVYLTRDGNVTCVSDGHTLTVTQ